MSSRKVVISQCGSYIFKKDVLSKKKKVFNQQSVCLIIVLYDNTSLEKRVYAYIYIIYIYTRILNNFLYTTLNEQEAKK